MVLVAQQRRWWLPDRMLVTSSLAAAPDEVEMLGRRRGRRVTWGAGLPFGTHA
jgi:hypothetical protein